jgi:hypothetical protein
MVRKLAVATLLVLCSGRPMLARSIFDSFLDPPPRRPAALAMEALFGGAPRPARGLSADFRRGGVRRLLQGECDANQTLLGSACVCASGFYDSKSVPHLLVDGVDTVCLGLNPLGDLATSCALFVNPLETPGVCSVSASASDGFAPYTAIDSSLDGGPRILPSVAGGPAWLQVDLEAPRVVGGVSFRQWLSCREGSTCAGAFVGYEVWVGSNAAAWNAEGNTRCHENAGDAGLDTLHDGGEVTAPCIAEGRYVYLVMPPSQLPVVMPVWHVQVHPPASCAGSTPCLQCPAGTVSRAGSLSGEDCRAARGVLVNHTVNFAPAGLNQSDFEAALPADIELLSYAEDLQAMLETCPAAYYCPSTTAMPVACPAGTFRDTHGAESLDDCSACPAGHYCPLASATIIACPAGTYRATPGAGAPRDCLPCDAGGYCPVASSAPVSCPAGSYRSTEGADSLDDCLVCPVGYHCAATLSGASVDPVACPAGTFNSRTAAADLTDCAQCPSGAYCPVATAQPVSCPAGTFRDALGASAVADCAVCPVGHYCPESSSDPTACNPGTFLAWEGAIQAQECAVCAAGTYCPVASAQPLACPAGTYLDTDGGVQLADCLACVEGHYCPSSSRAAVQCPAGTFRDALGASGVADCAVCLAGHYCGSASVSPSGCPAGTFREAGGAMSAADCLVCPVGRYCPYVTEAPLLCPAGTFRGETAGVDLSSCSPCPAGSYCAQGSVDPVQCPAGTYRTAIEAHDLSDCLVCPAGQFCPLGAAAPTSCLAGTYRTDPAAVSRDDCVVCPAGHYCRVRSATPVDCPAGTFRGLEGAIQPNDCLSCPAGAYCPLRSLVPVTCAAGTFRRNNGAWAPTHCLSCPVGLYCPLGTVDPLPCQAGTFRSSVGATSPAQCVDCPAGGYCPARSSAPIRCAAGFHRDASRATHLGNCLLCLPGTYAVDVGRDSNCPTCPANHYCRVPTLKQACPANTQAPPGSFSVLSCACIPGFACSYYKRVRAVSTLNVTLDDFNSDVGGVRTLFISAVAAAANVTASQVVINGVVSADASLAHPSGSRRLLSLQPSIGEQFDTLSASEAEETVRPGWGGRRLLSAPVPGIRVFTSVPGALRLSRLEHRLARAASGLLLAHQWEPSHRVHARPLA